MNKGFEFAFKGAMNAYGILAHKAVFWLGHVTGTGGESEAHYWPNDCDVCKEIAEFVSGWSPEHQLTMRAADLSPRDPLPLNQHIPTESGGAFFVHWSCHNCLPDDFDSSDRCHHCGKPRTDKVESR